MKIALNRFKHTAKIGGTKYVELPNGFGTNKFVTKFEFVFAYLNQSINSEINNLGSNENTTKLIATLDPRFDPMVEKVNGDQVTIGKTNYKITNVSLDDSDVLPIYRISLSIKSGF